MAGLSRRWIVSTAIVLATSFLAIPHVSAQAWPTKTIRIIVPGPPGSIGDLLGRLLADRLQPALGQPVIVENRAGANSLIGTQYVAQQQPDGYTLLLVTPTLTTAPVLQKVEFDPINDFAPISIIATSPLVVFVNTDVPVKTIREFVDFAKKQDVTYGSPGEGSSQNLAMVMLKNKLGIERMTGIAYRGSAPVATAVANRELIAGIAPVSTVMTMIEQGKVHPLVVFNPTRTPLLPDVPIVAEIVPGVAMDAWVGLLAPAKTPQAIIDRLAKATRDILHDPMIVETRLKPAALDPRASTPEEFAKQIREELVLYRELVKLANIKTESSP